VFIVVKVIIVLLLYPSLFPFFFSCKVKIREIVDENTERKLRETEDQKFELELKIKDLTLTHQAEVGRICQTYNLHS